MSVLNAFRVVRAGEALAEADAVDAQEELVNLPLAGVPVAVKENTPIAGLPTWNGSAAARSAVAEADHEVVRRLRGAGAVVVATSRAPELCSGRSPTTTTRSPAIRGGPTVRRAARPAAPARRSRPAWCRSRTATTASARSASRPPPADSSASSPAAAWCRRSSAPTTGSAWPSTASSRPRSPTPRSASPCWPAGRRRSSSSRAGCGSRSPPAARCRASGPTRPSIAALASATKLLVGAGHDTVDRRPDLPDPARPADDRDLVRRRRRRRDSGRHRPDDAAPQHPAPRRARRLGDPPRVRAGGAPHAVARPVRRLVRRQQRRRADDTGAGHDTAAGRRVRVPVLVGEHADGDAVRAVRRAVERGRLPGPRGADGRTPGRAAGRACSWSARPAPS